MKWTDSLIIKNVFFKDLKVGEGFEDNNFLYIKISNDYAFDVINDREEFFGSSTEITPRECEIIFH